jgi:hypothetical protein
MGEEAIATAAGTPASVVDFAAKVTDIGSELRALVKDLVSRHGLESRIVVGCESSSLTLRVQLITGCAAVDPEREFKRLASLFGLSESDFGRSFTRNGETFTISSLNEHEPRAPVITTCHGRTYRFALETVKRELQKAGLVRHIPRVDNLHNGDRA